MLDRYVNSILTELKTESTMESAFSTNIGSLSILEDFPFLLFARSNLNSLHSDFLNYTTTESNNILMFHVNYIVKIIEVF